MNSALLEYVKSSARTRETERERRELTDERETHYREKYTNNPSVRRFFCAELIISTYISYSVYTR